MTKDIETIRQNKERLDQKHRERLEILEEEKDAFQEKSKQLDRKEKEFELHNGEILNENKALNDKNKRQDELLHKLWKEECNRRKVSRNNYLDEEVKKEQNKSKIQLLLAFSIFVLFIIIIVCLYFLLPEGKLKLIDTILSNKMLSLLITTVIGALLFYWNYVAVQNWNNWYHNPSFAKTKRESVVVPDQMLDISFDDFMKL